MIRMISVEGAREVIDRMRDELYSSLGDEVIPISAAMGRKLSEDVVSVRMSPPYDVATMDGYAYDSASKLPLAIIEEVYAGNSTPRSLKPGEAVYITTGAFMPGGADCVSKVEDSLVDGDHLIKASAGPGENVLRAGTDFMEGETILRKGTIITAPMVGVLHVTGQEYVRAYRRIKVAVLSTGDEIRNGLIKNTNSPMVMAMLDSWGCRPVDIGVAGDDPEEVTEALLQASKEYSVIITIGGVSAGKKDPVVASLSDIGDIIFKGVKMKPGTPLIVSKVRGVPVFSLPGKPTGSYTAMELLVKRFILDATRDPVVDMPLEKELDFSVKGFDHVVYIRLKDGKALPMGYEGTSLKVFEGPKYGTSVLSSSQRSILADGFFIARDHIRAGQTVSVKLI